MVVAASRIQASSRLACLSLYLCLWSLAGCGPAGPQRVAVDGTVTLDGKPVNDATIVFTPKGEGLAAAASIVDGHFTLTELDGPTAGEHDVRINPNEAELEEMDPTGLAKSARRPRIPRIYQHSGELVAIVAETGQQELVFELTSKHKR